MQTLVLFSLFAVISFRGTDQARIERQSSDDNAFTSKPTNVTVGEIKIDNLIITTSPPERKNEAGSTEKAPSLLSLQKDPSLDPNFPARDAAIPDIQPEKRDDPESLLDHLFDAEDADDASLTSVSSQTRAGITPVEPVLVEPSSGGASTIKPTKPSPIRPTYSAPNIFPIRDAPKLSFIPPKTVPVSFILGQITAPYIQPGLQSLVTRAFSHGTRTLYQLLSKPTQPYLRTYSNAPSAPILNGPYSSPSFSIGAGQVVQYSQSYTQPRYLSESLLLPISEAVIPHATYGVPK